MRKIDQSRLPWIYLILCIIIVHRPLPPPTFLQTKVFLVVLLRFVETGLCELSSILTKSPGLCEVLLVVY